jgi:hypothetical protein
VYWSYASLSTVRCTLYARMSNGQSQTSSQSPASRSRVATPAKKGVGATACAVCSTETAAGKNIAHCNRCDKPCHMTCLVEAHKQKCGIPLKNNIDWLAKFIESMNFRFYCATCNASQTNDSSTDVRSDNVSSGIATRVEELHDKISNIEKLMAELQHSISQNNNAGVASQPSTSNGSAAKPEDDCKAVATYAQAASKDLAITVKAAVAESWKKQENIERSKSILAVYGLAEKEHDINELQQLFAKLGCFGRIISCTRIGRPDDGAKVNSNKKPRPIKVVMSSAADCTLLISASKGLKNEPTYATVYVKQWKTKEEMEKLKPVWQQCSQLNKDNATLANGKQPFVVHYGRLMQRTEDGKIVPFKSPPITTAKAALPTAVCLSDPEKTTGASLPPASPKSTQPKNGASGGRSAP